METITMHVQEGRRPRLIDQGELRLQADGVLHVRVREGLSIDGETMRRIVDAAWDFAPGRRPVLIDARRARGMSQEAREVATTGMAVEWTSALAVVVQSLATVAVADLMVMLVRPPYPTRVFRSVESARAWLRDGTA